MPRPEPVLGGFRSSFIVAGVVEGVVVDVVGVEGRGSETGLPGARNRGVRVRYTSIEARQVTTANYKSAKCGEP